MARCSPSRLLACSALALLCGCECVYTYRFEVRNATDSSIEVSFSSDQRDSVALIEGETSVVLCMPEGGIHPCWGSEDTRDIPRQDVDVLLDAIRVRKADGALSSRDFLSNDTWFYNDGVFRAYVTDAEFD